MNKKYFLKKFIPVYTNGNTICIGYAQDAEKYITIENNEENYLQLEKVVKSGIDVTEFNTDLYKRLNAFGYLEKLEKYLNINDINRAELYFQQLDNQNFTNDVRNKKILIFGAGAGGSVFTYSLAQIGFNNLVAVDDDIVSSTDLIKSMVFDKNDVGTQKVFALERKIKQNFDISIQTINKSFIAYDDLNEIISNVNPDFIVKACDPALIFRVNLNAICFKKKIPFYFMAYAFEKLRLGPLYVPEFTSCDESLNQMMKKAYGEHCDFKTDKKLFTGFLVHPAISYNVNLLTSYSLKEILMFLTGQYEYCFTIGRIIEYNPLSLGYISYELECEKDCNVCGGNGEMHKKDNEVEVTNS